MSKNVKCFKLKMSAIVRSVDPMGAATATDKIVVDGMNVGYMYREEPISDTDSGWRFFSGTEDEDYLADNNNSDFYDVNTIANYDPAIIQCLDQPIGSQLERIPIETMQSNNWYLWPGEVYSEASDFFKPLHTLHLAELRPKALIFLVLPSGWRFLFDDKYEDVWYDENLLNV